jgi:hypothetical protein
MGMKAAPRPTELQTSDLCSFREYLEVRRRHWEKRRLKSSLMHEDLVLNGRIVLERGFAAVLTDASCRTSRGLRPSRVSTIPEWRKLVPDEQSIRFHILRELPGPLEICRSCGLGWSMSNIGDLRVPGPMHRSCARRESDREACVRLQDLLREAGFHDSVVTPFSPKDFGLDRHHDSVRYSVDWLSVRTPILRFDVERSPLYGTTRVWAPTLKDGSGSLPRVGERISFGDEWHVPARELLPFLRNLTVDLIVGRVMNT